jgi:hypothetical protein
MKGKIIIVGLFLLMVSEVVFSQSLQYNRGEIAYQIARHYCNQANRLRWKIARAEAEYYAYTRSEYPSRYVLESFYNDVAFARAEMRALEEEARVNEIPPGWLRCQFDR